MNNPQQLITENLNIWTAAIKKRGSQGRGSSKKIELHGIKKLRDLILGLGLSGNLCESSGKFQGNIDELIEIARKNYQIDKNRKLKDYEHSIPILNEFNIPGNWVWKRVSNLCDLQTGATPSRQHPEYFGGDINWLVSGDINKGLIYECNGRITSEGLDKSNCKILSPGTVMIALNGQGKTRATVALLKIHAACNQSLVGIIPIDNRLLMPEFLFLALKYRYYEIRDITGQNQRRGLNMGLVSELSIPVPPIEVQSRIVAKVDELMALCDQLEQQTEDSLTAHQTLVETLLKSLLDAAQITPGHASTAQSIQQNQNENQKDKTKGDPFQQAWKMIWENFDVLFTTEHSIDQLKQTILQLAVMGKLVPQNENDEPASVLLEKIAAEKEQLIKDKKIKKQKQLPEISEDEKPFELPKGWGCCRLIDLIPQFQNGASSRGDSEGEDTVVLRLADIKNWKVSLEDTRSICIEEKSIKRYSLIKSDVLIIRVNGSADIVGRFITCTDSYKAIYCDHFIRMRFPIMCFSSGYLSLLGSSSLIRNRIADLFVSTAGQKTVNQNHINSLVVTLPPLMEQPRIVDKVDELMALCDTLKERIRESQATQLYLADAMADSALGRTTIIKLEEKGVKRTMTISTELSLGSVEYDNSAILAPLISSEGADAKIVWSKSKLELPDFYKQLKLEIKAGFLAMPAKAEFEG